MNHADHVSALVPSVSIANLVNQRDGLLARMEAVIAELRVLAQDAGDANMSLPDVEMHSGWNQRSERVTNAHPIAEAVEYVRCHIDRSAWKYLMDQSGLRTFMSASARDKWDESLSKRSEIPHLTLANISATFAALYDQRGAMMEEGVVECFKNLSWHYKTNTPVKFGKRIIVHNLTNGYRDRGANALDDLVRVFCKMDNKPEPDHRHSTRQLLSDAGATSWSARVSQGTVETDYLVIKWFGNGNGHITFKRLDLVDQLNRIIAKHHPGALPAPR